jgi:hypothetical protein
MLLYLKANSAFSPEEVQILVAAFDQVWETIQASGAKYDTEAHAEAARMVIAKQIIEDAAQGERDQRRLCDGALLALTQVTAAHAEVTPRRSRSPVSIRAPSRDRVRERVVWVRWKASLPH